MYRRVGEEISGGEGVRGCARGCERQRERVCETVGEGCTGDPVRAMKKATMLV